MTILIKCQCGKHFPLNPDKHRHDKTVYCPFCRTSHHNPTKIHWNWKPNLSWIQRKLADHQKKREVTRFLDKYFPKNPENGMRVFSLNQYMKGIRPSLAQSYILHTLKLGNKNVTSEQVADEVEWLEKLGVKIKEA